MSGNRTLFTPTNKLDTPNHNNETINVVFNISERGYISKTKLKDIISTIPKNVDVIAFQYPINRTTMINLSSITRFKKIAIPLGTTSTAMEYLPEHFKTVIYDASKHDENDCSYLRTPKSVVTVIIKGHIHLKSMLNYLSKTAQIETIETQSPEITALIKGKNDATAATRSSNAPIVNLKRPADLRTSGELMPPPPKRARKAEAPSQNSTLSQKVNQATTEELEVATLLFTMRNTLFLNTMTFFHAFSATQQNASAQNQQIENNDPMEISFK